MNNDQLKVAAIEALETCAIGSGGANGFTKTYWFDEQKVKAAIAALTAAQSAGKDEREDFEAWVHERYVHPEEVLRNVTSYAWDAWQERASLAKVEQEPFGIYVERDDGTKEFRRTGEVFSPTIHGGKYWTLYEAQQAQQEAGKDVALLQRTLQKLADEFKRVFPIYYYAEPWAHNRNIVLMEAESLLAAMQASPAQTEAPQHSSSRIGGDKGPCSCGADRTAAGDGQSTQAFDFHAHLARQAAWSEKTFGPGMRTAGVCDHIRKELLEIEAEPWDLREWIDVVILGLDGAWRCGGTPAQIIDGIVAKQTKNESRTWPDWRTADPNKAIEHDRSADSHAAKGAAHQEGGA